jgi:hypothetical protein
MHVLIQQRSSRPERAFAIVEGLIATFMVALLVVGSLSAISLARVQDAKNRELGIIRDFGTHYLEFVRGMDFDAVAHGKPINSLFDGKAGAPLVMIPATDAWISIDSTNYQTFHPELTWLTNRSVEMKVKCTATPAVTPSAKHLQLELRWLPPLHGGNTQHVRFDLFRVRDA